MKRMLLATLMVTTAQAGILKEHCRASLDACGVVFTSAPATPSNLTTANCTSPVAVTYTIENQSAGNTVINFALINNDSLGTDAVVVDPSSTCTNGQTLNSTASCNIVLDFQPCDSGSLDRRLTVTPVSTQTPVSQVLQTTVGSSAFVYCPA